MKAEFPAAWFTMKGGIVGFSVSLCIASRLTADFLLLCHQTVLPQRRNACQDPNTITALV